MKVTGFSFIKNAIKYDFPVKEAIKSVLPLCESFVVAVGDSEDDTRVLISTIDPLINIVDTVWDESILKDGAVLADETNKALQAIPEDTKWCIYIQGDEVMHEADYDEIRASMIKYADDDQVDGLLFRYHHFYGSYDYVGSSSNWYRHEIRIIKNNRNIYSYRDAQGFRKDDNIKLNVKLIDASVYHYGWVKPPEIMFEKVKNDRLVRHGIADSDMPVVSADTNAFDYSQIDQLHLFKGTHPKVMLPRIKKNNWQFDFDITTNKMSVKERIKRFSEKLIGRPIGEYRNYKIV